MFQRYEVLVASIIRTVVMTEAASISEMLLNFYQTICATSQKTAIFKINIILLFLFPRPAITLP
jgi:hypothetical protein